MVVMAMVIKYLAWKRRKRKTKSSRQRYSGRSFLVWRSRHLASVITFRNDSRTIKRGETHIETQLSKCH
jgi:hypothetical protein